MKRARTVFLIISMASVLLFSGVLLASRNTQDVLFRALGNLAEVIHLVETEYVDELNQEALALALDAGLVESLDRAAAVLPPDRVNEYLEFVEAPPPFGLGLSSRLGSAAVQFVLDGSPAEAAGLDSWEVIELVDGVNSRGRPLWQIRLALMEHEIRGEPVELTVFDRAMDERREVVLEPLEWTLQPVTAALRDDTTVITLTALNQDAVERIGGLLPENGRLVLDLRQLRWGLEPQAIALADVFVHEGVLGSWQGRRAGSKSYPATESIGADTPVPVVVVGPETNGVGEILASALQRSGAILVGQKTAGHAPYMNLVQDADVAIWMPVGEWLAADGEPISGRGIDPDELVEPGDSESSEDPAIQRAIEVLGRELEKAA
jgi:C-terminal processing protease CtpA/Prc